MKALLVILGVFFAVQPSTGAAQVATKSFPLTAGTPVPVGELEAGGISLSREVLLTFEPRSVKVVGERPAETG